MIKPFTVKGLCAAAALVFACAHAVAENPPLDTIIAIVDDDVVLASEFNERLEAAKINIARANQPMPPLDILEKELLERMIVERIQLQMANRAGVRISDSQLNETMARIASQNNMNLLQFKEALEQEGQSYIKMREQVRHDMLLQTVQGGQVNRRIQISEQEIDNFLASEEGQQITAPEYLIHHTLVPLENDNDDEAKAFAEQLIAQIKAGTGYDQVSEKNPQYPSRGTVLGWRKASDLPSLLVDIAPRMQQGQSMGPIRSPSGYHIVTLVEKRGGAELVKQTRARHILLKASAIRDDAATRKQLENIRQRIVDGEDFGALAREYSEDIGSAQEGGDLGWSSPGQMVPAFENAMATTEIDAISNVFKSRFGWHVLTVEGRRDKDISEDLRRNTARNFLHERKFKDERQAWLQKIRDEAYVDIK